MIDRCRTDFADTQNKKECGGNRQWQNHYLRNWAANIKGKAENALEWVQRLNNIRACAREIVNEEIIYN